MKKLTIPAALLTRLFASFASQYEKPALATKWTTVDLGGFLERSEQRSDSKAHGIRPSDSRKLVRPRRDGRVKSDDETALKSPLVIAQTCALACIRPDQQLASDLTAHFLIITSRERP